MARRRRSAPKRRYTRRKKNFTVSITRLAQLGWAYRTISGNEIGTVVNALVNALMSGQGDVAQILMAELAQTLDNVTRNPTQIAIQTSVGIFGFQLLRSFIGSKQVFKIGKFRLTT